MEARPSSVIRLEDYRPPPFRILETVLVIDLDFRETRITARHRVERTDSAQQPLVLDADADALTLGEIRVDGVAIPAAAFRVEADKLTIHHPPAAATFDLAIENSIRPECNTALSGLYSSGDMLCTQCEAEGFRRITPAIDRPDNLAVYTVTLRAERKTLPRLLCNGNLIEQGECGGGRHYAVWHDPFPKPTYLFAVVAGDLACREASFVTCSGRGVTLRFFAELRDIDKCAHAMASLQRAMAWDERVYGREYDLDLFNVVAVSDFNMGAMENKSLNIFNTQAVLADPALATDGDFEHVEAVIGHEYFHNWSGNRVTCRDWFQLSLKEGFTVFREQQFSADMGSAAVKRIADAALMRNHQFREDAGPLAHPVRPNSYIEINNFYTTTVYEKGAEVIRMLHTLLGAEMFRRGSDLYFARHDGQAVTTDDFVAAMEDISGMDLTGFKNWYSQAGTPVVDVETAHDAARSTYTITLNQHCPPTPGQPRKKPFVIPVRAALFDRHGKRLPLSGDDGDGEDRLLVLSDLRQSFTFHGVESEPVASLLRGFSAPVELRQPLSEDELALLLAHDDDPYTRWEAGQRLFLRYILAAIQSDAKPDAKAVTAAFESVLDQADADPALQAEILTLPSETYIGEHLSPIAPIDPAAVWRARQGLKRHLGKSLRAKLLQHYRRLDLANDGSINAVQIAARSLRNTCLDYLAALDDAETHILAARLLADAKCMTDSVAALVALANSSKADRQTLLDDFYRRWQNEPLVVDKWLRIQASVPRAETLARVKSLTRHAAFDPTNPNKVYSLILGFSHANPSCFHAADGAGYRFAARWVAQLDSANPQVAARLASAFTHWRKYAPTLKAQMRAALREIADLPNLSRDVAEIVGKSLADEDADAGETA